MGAPGGGRGLSTGRGYTRRGGVANGARGVARAGGGSGGAWRRAAVAAEEGGHRGGGGGPVREAAAGPGPVRSGPARSRRVMRQP